jgi:hypothetical protein
VILSGKINAESDGGNIPPLQRHTAQVSCARLSANLLRAGGCNNIAPQSTLMSSLKCPEFAGVCLFIHHRVIFGFK